MLGALGEMDRVFNMGVGMILAVRPEDADAVTERLVGGGVNAWAAGAVREGISKVALE